MKFKDFSKYIGIFILGVLLIAVYKTFDNFSAIWALCGKIFKCMTPFIFGGGIAFLLYRPCRAIEQKLEGVRFAFLSRHRRGISVAAVLLLLCVVLLGLFWLLVPVLLKSFLDFFNQIPYLSQNLSRFLDGFSQFGLSADHVLSTVSAQSIMEGFNLNQVSRYMESVWAAGTTLFNLLMSAIISVYILLDRAHIKKVAKRVCLLFIRKEKNREVFYKYTNRAFHYLNAYVFCTLMDALIIGVLSFIVLLPFGVPYLPLMAFMLGLFNLIPYFGAILASLLTALLTAVMVSPMRGVWVAVVLIILQQIDGNVIKPKLVHDHMDIKPLWVIFAILLFGELFGIWGILLGVPVMAVILSAIEDLIHLREAKVNEQPKAEETKEKGENV